MYKNDQTKNYLSLFHVKHLNLPCLEFGLNLTHLRIFVQLGSTNKTQKQFWSCLGDPIICWVGYGYGQGYSTVGSNTDWIERNPTRLLGLHETKQQYSQTYSNPTKQQARLKCMVCIKTRSNTPLLKKYKEKSKHKDHKIKIIEGQGREKKQQSHISFCTKTTKISGRPINSITHTWWE